MLIDGCGYDEVCYGHEGFSGGMETWRIDSIVVAYEYERAGYHRGSIATHKDEVYANRLDAGLESQV